MSSILMAEVVGSSWGFLPSFGLAEEPPLSPKSNLQLIILRLRSMGAGQVNFPAGTKLWGFPPPRSPAAITPALSWGGQSQHYSAKTDVVWH